MENMTNMKLSKADKKRPGYGAPDISSGPDYPWGLSINLDTAALKKLGIKDLPEAGEECMIHAVGKVTRVSQSASDKNEDRSMEIQIMKLEVVCKETDSEMWDRVKKDRKAVY